MLYLLYEAGRFISLILPLRISYWIANILGSLYYLLAKRDRTIATNNIKVVLSWTGDTRRLRHTSRMVFVNFSRYLIEFFRTPEIDLKYIGKHIRVEGRENLDRALDLGKGVILLSAHLGNWELGAMVLSMLGYRVNIVAWTHKSSLVNGFFLQQRHNKGIKVIPLGTGIRGVFSALKNNETVAVLGDIDYVQPETGINVKFFGRNTIMPKGPAAFSLKTGAPIVTAFLFREKIDKFKLVLGPSIIYRTTGEESYDLTKLTQDLVKIIESYIGQHPAQWFMLRQRWQT